METKYFANVKSNAKGENEVHKESCFFLPIRIHRELVGKFSNYEDVLKAAMVKFHKAIGCEDCMKSIEEMSSNNI